jgi:hypothetical protein
VSTELAFIGAWEPMSAQECGQVIGLASAIDNRIPQPSAEMLTVWYAVLRRVPYEAAEHALTEWYASERYRETRDSISPADIAGWWRDRRRHAEVDRPAEPFDAERIHRGVDLAFAELARRKAIRSGVDPDTAMDVADSEAQSRRLLRSVRCPWEPCQAGLGRPCTRHGGVELAGDRVHDSRRQLVRHGGVSSPPG